MSKCTAISPTSPEINITPEIRTSLQWWMMIFQEVYSVYWNSNVWNCYYKNIQIGFALLIHSNSQPDCSHLGSCCSFVRFVRPVISSTHSLKKTKKQLELFTSGYLWGRCARTLWLCKLSSNTEGITSTLFFQCQRCIPPRGGMGGVYFTQVHHCRMDR